MVYAVPSKVNIRTIKDIHSEFLAHVKNNAAVEIDLQACEEIDLSLIQLLESARKSAEADNKRISLTKPANDIVLSTLKRAGLTEAFSAADTKFWLHKEVL
jgi:anti-anti-sigma regulatory factor